MMFKIMWFFIITLFSRLYGRVDILLQRRNHLYDCINSLKGAVSTPKTSLTSPLFIEMAIPSQESERPCICVSCNCFDSVICFAFLFILFFQMTSWWETSICNFQQSMSIMTCWMGKAVLLKSHVVVGGMSIVVLLI